MADNARDDPQVEAAWAALDVAKRGLWITALGALTNLLVVFVALSAPFMQQYLERTNQDKEYHSAKVELFRRADSQLRSLDDWSNTLGSYLDSLARIPAGAMSAVRAIRISIDQSIHDLAEVRSEDRDLLRRHQTDFAFERALEILADTDSLIIDYYEEIGSLVDLGWFRDTDVTDRIRANIARDLAAQRRELQAMIAANTNGGPNSVLSGPVREAPR